MATGGRDRWGSGKAEEAVQGVVARKQERQSEGERGRVRAGEAE